MTTNLPPPSLELTQFNSLTRGPRLIVLGAVHGNEVCGSLAIRRVLAEFASGQLRIKRGRVSFVPVTNGLAYAKGKREGDRNLNRDFRPAVVPLDNEDRIANVLAPLLASHDILLDLHSFNSQGDPFIFLGPENNSDELEPFSQQAQEEDFAAALGPKRVVHGWMPAFALGVSRRANDKVSYGVGTTEYMRSQGGIAVTVECGNHADPLAPEVAYQAIHRALRNFDLIEVCDVHGAVVAIPSKLEAKAGPSEVLELYEVIDKNHVDDTFIKPWRSFDAIQAGEVIAHRAAQDGRPGQPVTAPHAGRVVFPNANAVVGKEWFYLARMSHRSLG
jgi:uncharacterized protein